IHTYVRLSLSRNGSVLAIGVGDGVRFISAAGDTMGFAGKAHLSDIRLMAISPDGKIAASASDDLTVKFWQTEGASFLGGIGFKQEITALEFSQDGVNLAIAHGDEVDLFSVNSREKLLTLTIPGSKIHCMEFSPDGQILATGGESADHKGELYFWDAGAQPANRIQPE
ncbi:MAG: WD40 repeat domain-containing protein, partial [Candidatus Acidiferrum sp.]